MIWGNNVFPERSVPPLEQRTKECSRCEPATNIYQCLRPTLLTMKILGRFPYFMENGDMKVYWFSRWTAYSVLLYILYSYFLVFDIPELLKQRDSFDENLNATISLLLNASQVVPIIYYFENPNLVRYFNKWSHFEKELQAVGIKLETKLKFWVLFVCLIQIPISCICGYWETNITIDVRNDHHFYLSVLLRAIIMLGYTTTGVWWNYICFYITLCSGQLLRHTIQITKMGERDRHLKLAVCRQLWIHLADLTIELGHVKTASVYGTLLASGIIAIASCYAILLNNTVYLTPFVVFFLGACVQLFLTCDFGHRATSSVGWTFKNEILNLNFTHFDENSRNEINLFLQTISMRYPDIILGGFFTVNRILLVSCMSSAVTYLIVLLQFNSQDNVFGNVVQKATTINS